MQRPDLDTLACVNADCQHYGRPGQGNLTIRKVYGQDGKCLYKINFIFVSEVFDDAFDIIDEVSPARIGPEFNPFILHKSP
jgi:hypothetical protein